MINVALVGMGNIGLLFDYDKLDENKAYSHTKAIYLNKHFDLKYVVDPNKKNLPFVQDLFPNVNYLDSYTKIDSSKIDVLVIATPTHLHFEVLNFFKNSDIKLFLVEKPLFYSKNEYENIEPFFKDKIVVNYMRRFQKPFENLKEHIEKNSFGDTQKIVLNYVKGLKNNASHFIDIINFLFDRPKILTSTILGNSSGFSDDDLSYDVFIKIEYKKKIIPIHFVSFDHEKYNLIELKLYFENKVVEFINSEQKISYYDINESIEYKGYNFVDKEPSKQDTISKKLIYNVYEKIYLNLSKNEEIVSSFDDELANFRFIEKILENKEDNKCQY
mgnify:CR=1 FL=1